MPGKTMTVLLVDLMIYDGTPQVAHRVPVEVTPSRGGVEIYFRSEDGRKTSASLKFDGGASRDLYAAIEDALVA